MSGAPYEVLAVKYADSPGKRRVDNFLRHDLHDGPSPMDFHLWVARNEDRTVLIDLGGTEENARRRGHCFHCHPVEALKRVGVEADAIQDAIVTHMHWDHCGNLRSFPNARVHLQAAEMAFATGPGMLHDHLRRPFCVDAVCDAVRRVHDGKLAYHQGSAEITPGIEVHHVGGHSLGLQVVRVMTRRGWLVLASDAAHFYENFQTENPFPIVVDMAQMLAGFDTLRRLASASDAIVPGHDPAVMAIYPPPAPGLEGFAVRLDVGPKIT